MILELATVISLLGQCQNQVEPSVLKRIIDTESSSRPFAIAVVGADSVSQPKTKEDAIQIAKDLEEGGFNFSVGLMQVNKNNFHAHGLTIESAFDSCKNIEAGAAIYSDCYHRAKKKYPSKPNKELLDDAASCYYSGNFLRGYKPEGSKKLSYVDKFNTAKPLPKNGVIKESYPSEEVQHVPVKSQQVQPWDVFGDFAQ